MQHMVDAGIFPRPLHRQHILRLRHDADLALVALRVGADVAQVLIGQILTDRTKAHRFFRVHDRVRERLRLLRRKREYVE